MRRTTVYIPDDLLAAVKRVAAERGTSEAELIRSAVRREVSGPASDESRRRLLAALGTLDRTVYGAGYLDEVRAGWAG